MEKGYRLFKPERKVSMTFGSDFFPILNFLIKVIRLLFECFGDEDDKKKVEASKDRSANGNGDAC